MVIGLTDTVCREHMDEWACFERVVYAITLANKTHGTWLSVNSFSSHQTKLAQQLAAPPSHMPLLQQGFSRISVFFLSKKNFRRKN